MKKDIKLNGNINIYKRLADEKADGGDLLGALGLYYTVYRWNDKDFDAIADIADCYADMGLLELSNRFWFLYLIHAPLDKQSVAYEELAINFFYMDNLWASGYYFHLKMERDGFIAEEGLDEEIIKFFSSSAVKREEYYLAYPFDKADYSYIAKNAKRAFGAGDIRRAVKLYGKIPAECRTEEISGDYAAALFLEKDDEKMIEVCKDSLNRHGDNVNAYCNLSSLYQSKGDSDKAEYYYNLALASEKGEKSEFYKIATCAIERGDHLTAKRCMEVILDERPYDDVMNFFYALALSNLGEIEKGLKAMEKSLRLNPDDVFYRHYYSILKDVARKKKSADDYLPFVYAKALPRAEETAGKRIINKMVSGKLQIPFAEAAETLEAALYSDDRKTAKSAAFLLGTANSPKAKEIIYSALIDNEVDDEVKNSLVYLLVAGGEKDRINAVLGNYFASVKPKKVVFEKKDDGALYMSAYALVITKSLAFGVCDSAKIAFNMNTLYTDYAELIRFNGFGAETIAALCYLLCGFGTQDNVKNVCAAFGVDKNIVGSVGEFYFFVKKTKPLKMKERAEKGNRKKEKNIDQTR